MTPYYRFFLIVEGAEDAYPNYKSAKISFTCIDPGNLQLKNLFVCSPLFSMNADGVGKLPEVSNLCRITFLMVPNVYPAFDQIIKLHSFTNQVWFSLGLANLVVIEKKDSTELSESIIQILKKDNNLTATEVWNLENGVLSTNEPRKFTIEHANTEIENFNISISDKLPLHLKFSVSEFIISINKFLTASKKFTPYYFAQHVKTIEASTELVNDLSFLHLDDTYTPTVALLKSLNVNTAEEALVSLKAGEALEKKEELINDRNGRLVQFNSSMSYIYSQAYAGTFPIFDHIGLVRRHSLLGIGTAISALFELLSQLEEALYQLPFEDFTKTNFHAKIPSTQYFLYFKEPSLHVAKPWIEDSTRIALIELSDPIRHPQPLPIDFFCRLPFYSGRLGFREYDLSATAAIQVLIEANSLEWHVINYTHEIIHNHVRIILNNLIIPPHSIRDQSFEDWLDHYLIKIEQIYKNPNDAYKDLTYKDYFIVTLVNFAIYSNYHGSLTIESHYSLLSEIHASIDKFDYKLPKAATLRKLILSVYKDISEVFVHVIDYTYIYGRKLDEYLLSIWTSWSTESAVANDIKQYILRTLLIIALGVEGKASFRYEKSKLKFLEILELFSKKSGQNYIFKRIKTLLEDKLEKDLKTRFYNCLVVADLVNLFFIGKLQKKLDNNDNNTLIEGTVDEEGNLILYNLESNSFEADPITSKVRFVLDQLLRASSSNKKEIDDKAEKASAWLLLTLSSHNYD